MLRTRQFWIGFALGYALIAFVPSANLFASLKGKGA